MGIASQTDKECPTGKKKGVVEPKNLSVDTMMQTLAGCYRTNV